MNYQDDLYSENLTYVGKAINFDIELLELITHFSRTEADAKLSDLIVDVVWYDPLGEEVEPKERIKKSLVNVNTILEDINYTIPKELEDGLIPEEEYEKQDSILKTTFSDSFGKQYSLGIIFLGLYIVNNFIEVGLTNIKRKSKHKSKKAKLKSKSSKSRGFGKK